MDLKRVILEIGILIVAGLALFSCTIGNDSGEKLPAIIKVGVLPDESDEKIRRRYEPLMAYLESETGISFELTVPEKYEHLLTLFGEKKIDFANFGGYTFVKAHLNNGAVPLVYRGKDTRFESVFIVRADDPGQSIQDFKGRSLSFGSKFSTSGHIMPRHFLIEQGIEPETFFSEIQYSGKHDLTAYNVFLGKADLGVANSLIIQKMISDGRLNQGDIRILWKTPPYVDYVWATRSAVGPSTRRKIRNAFLKLSLDNPKHVRILRNLDARYYLPASRTDFIPVQEVMKHLENHL